MKRFLMLICMLLLIPFSTSYADALKPTVIVDGLTFDAPTRVVVGNLYQSQASSTNNDKTGWYDFVAPESGTYYITLKSNQEYYNMSRAYIAVYDVNGRYIVGGEGEKRSLYGSSSRPCTGGNMQVSPCCIVGEYGCYHSSFEKLSIFGMQ